MAVRFDAASDRLSHSASSPPSPNGGFTVTLWAYVSVSRGDYSTLFRLWTASDSNVPITYDTDSNGLNGPHYFTTAGIVNGSLNMAVGEWRKLAVSRGAGGTGKNYAALPTGSTTVTSGAIGSIADPIGVTLAGRTPAEASEWFNGRLAYVRVWSRELSQAEIEAEWASPTPVSATGLWADWPLETATDLTDHSGNDHTLVSDAAEGATAVTTEDGPLAVNYTKSGGAATAGAGTGAKALTQPQGYIKGGGAASSGAAVGAAAVIQPRGFTKSGGAVGVGVGGSRPFAIPPPVAGWPPLFAGPERAPLVLVSGPELAPLVLFSARTAAPLVLISGPVSAPSPGATEHPMMARRGAFRRSLPAPADEFVIEQFRQLRARRRADKIRKANQ